MRKMDRTVPGCRGGRARELGGRVPLGRSRPRAPGASVPAAGSHCENTAEAAPATGSRRKSACCPRRHPGHPERHPYPQYGGLGTPCNRRRKATETPAGLRNVRVDARVTSVCSCRTRPRGGGGRGPQLTHLCTRRPTASSAGRHSQPRWPASARPLRKRPQALDRRPRRRTQRGSGGEDHARASSWGTHGGARG